MKALKILVGTVFVLLIAFWLVGIFTDSVTTQYTVTIEKPIEETYDAFMEEDLLDEWLTGFKSAELISESGDSTGVGNVYKMVFEEGGQLYEFEETITGVEWDNYFSFDLNSEFFKSSTKVEFLDLGNKTQVTATTVTKGKGFVFKSMLPFMKNSMEAREKDDYDRLKKIIESR